MLGYDWIAPIYDVLIRAEAFLDGIKPSKAREQFINTLGLMSLSHVLEVGVGTGINMSIATQQMGSRGLIVGMDNSIPMLVQGKLKLVHKGMASNLAGGNAANLPFKDDAFDIAYIFGAFNLLPDQEGSVRELMRVTAPGGLIVISDKSLIAYHKNSLRRKLLQVLEPKLSAPPPLQNIPLSEDQLELSWTWNDLFYILRFRNPKSSGERQNSLSREIKVMDHTTDTGIGRSGTFPNG